MAIRSAEFAVYTERSTRGESTMSRGNIVPAKGACTSSRRGRALAWFAPALALIALLAAVPVPAALAHVPALQPAGGSASHGPAHHRSLSGISATPSTTRPHWLCPKGACDAIVDARPRRDSNRWRLLDARRSLEGSGELGGLSPADLQSAYQIPTSTGSGQTIALIDAWDYPNAEADLAAYRAHYGLPACTKASGCFKKVNQGGEEANYPKAEPEWNGEAALDLDMASAACPECKIMLVEAANEGIAYLAAAQRTAVQRGATELSNSWGITERFCKIEPHCVEFIHFNFSFPGVVITASAGDGAFDSYYELNDAPELPANSPDVVAVGGTRLRRSGSERGWSEEAWVEPEEHDGTGGGCGRYEPKPIWQQDIGCSGRVSSDVAVDGACESPVSVYWSGEGGWNDFCGTSVGAPLVAGIAAHWSSYARSLPGADALYQSPSSVFDVAAGGSEPGTGECGPRQPEYLCRALSGYDGPTGVGSPDGAIAATAFPPIAATEPAGGVSGTAAVLNGQVGPQGLETSYHFEYGPTTGYGSSVPVPDASAGAGTAPVEVSASLAGLTEGGSYHYRLVATNAAGTSYGRDIAFATAAPAVGGVEASTGPADGGTAVTITGEHLLGASAVMFGTHPALRFTVNSASSITATSPGGLHQIDVTVTTPAGTSPATPADRFTYTVGPVLAWGYDDAELGDPADMENTILPGSETASFPIEMLGVPQALDVAAGGADLALLTNGTVMASSRNFEGEAGHGDYKRHFLPVPVCAVGVSECSEGPYLEDVTSVASGYFHSLALLKNGTVVAWGTNRRGQLGTGAGLNSSPVPEPVCLVVEFPCQAQNVLSGVVAISAGFEFSLALLKDGTVLAWGGNGYGQLGLGKTNGPEKCAESTSCSRRPRPVELLAGVTSIAAGQNYSVALLQNGTVMSWGGPNSLGEIGDGTTEERTIPVPVCAAGEHAPCSHRLGGVEAIATGAWNSFAVLESGSVLGWGENFEGDLGTGSLEGPEHCPQSCSKVPIEPSGLGEVLALGSGQYGAAPLALASSGAVMSWGSGYWGALGNGTSGEKADATLPVRVCSPEAGGTCPEGPYLTGPLNAVGEGTLHSVVARGSLPRITSVHVSTGPPSGGTTVKINGYNLAGATAVSFGGSAASGVEVRSPDEVRATSPAGTGTVDVTVTTAEGTTATGPADQFAYETPTPEYGRCIRVTTGTGTFGNAGCTTPGGERKYVWYPAFGAGHDLVKKRFTTKQKAATEIELETPGTVPIRCLGETSSGEYTGLKTVGGMQLTLTLCHREPAVTCQSAGAERAEIVTNVLSGTLGVVSASPLGPAEDELGLDLAPTEGETVAQFACTGGPTVTLDGSVVVPIKANATQPKVSLKFKASRDVQLPSHLAGREADVLEAELEESGVFQLAGLSATLQLTNEEPIEANSVL
jgi:alpha-tubulin suppressor-like RCC1 family protein